MDLAIELSQRLHLDPALKPGFNPCFSGSCYRIYMSVLNIMSKLVSILVLVDLAIEYIYGELHNFTDVVFQSLF